MFAGVDDSVHFVAINVKLFKVCCQAVSTLGFPGEDVKNDGAVAADLTHFLIRRHNPRTHRRGQARSQIAESPLWVLLFDGCGE
jgi:hypothetical protein